MQPRCKLEAELGNIPISGSKGHLSYFIGCLRAEVIWSKLTSVQLDHPVYIDPIIELKYNAANKMCENQYDSRIFIFPQRERKSFLQKWSLKSSRNTQIRKRIFICSQMNCQPNIEYKVGLSWAKLNSSWYWTLF